MADLQLRHSGLAVIVSKDNAQSYRQVLESSGVWDKTRRLQKTGHCKVAIPVFDAGKTKNVLEDTFGIIEDGFEISDLELPLSKFALMKSPYDILVDELRNLLSTFKMILSSDLLATVPKHWEVHGNLVLLPSSAFPQENWAFIGDELWTIVAKSLGFQRVARKHSISADSYRSPQVELLLGDSGWVEHIDNGIKYNYDITRCMFSSGNVTEKLRVANFDCRGETVVDLYAGIGYFTLPYLVHAKAKTVHACEWNPSAVEALKKNLVLNGVEKKCVIHEGDNQQVCPEGIADRVNLGLIPSSEAGWPVACRALKLTGGILHIHSNVTALSKDCELTLINSTWDKTECNGVLVSPGSVQVELDVSCRGDRSSVKNHENGENYDAVNQRKTGKNTCDCDITTSDRPSCEDSVYKVVTKTSCINNDCLDQSSVKLRPSSNTLKSREHHWLQWAKRTGLVIEEILSTLHTNKWRIDILHIEHVKTYAPHIDHIVLDLECRPRENI